ncbi:cardiolipin synthase [Neobacillus mesonae]|uniref:cardiolipin synthase n=1 Tax=Neobacillus mesonae TaxID=1193713 RepID=UPI00082F06BB|nr:cardiolipin synthase [Neobacillus mesonae]
MYVLGISLLLFIIWLVLDFRLGRKRHLTFVRDRGTPVLSGRFEIFTHGKELFRNYFDVLRQAKKRIYVLFYIVKDDPFGEEFFSILKAKAQEGVEVRLLVDRLGSLTVKKAAVADLRRAGVKVAFSDRVELPFPFYSANVRNHRKISVVDEKIGFLGGFNIGMEYIDEGSPPLNPWRDYHLKITGESAHFLQEEFLFDWHRATSAGLKNFQKERLPVFVRGAADMEASAELTFSPQRDFDAGIRHRLIPTEGNQLEELFIRLIQQAEEKIMIGTPYFIPSRRILDELLEALRRGVELTIVVPFTADHILVQEASFRYFRRLLREGAVVYQYKNGFYHAKIIVIDDKVCDIGTANFDKRSLYLNKEINCYIYDADFINRLKDVLAKDIRDSEPLTLETLEKPNLFRSLKEILARTVSYFL